MLANSRLSMASKDTGIKENIWFHQDKPNKDFAVLTISGAGRSLELLSADTEGEGEAIQKELAEFLGLPSQDAAISRS